MRFSADIAQRIDIQFAPGSASLPNRPFLGLARIYLRLPDEKQS